MVVDVTLVPFHQDGFDVWKVLVERRTSDACVLGDLRHGHCRQSVLGDEGCRGVQDGFADLTPVRVDRLAPQPGPVPKDTLRRGEYTVTCRIHSVSIKWARG